jgi:tRNA(fMet)-specific endonuclease VapC
VSAVYLLDTNILSDVMRNPTGRVAERLSAVGEQAVTTSIVVASELRFGALRRGSAALISRVEDVLSRLPVAPLAAPADELYADVRSALERSGRPIGANDMLIAAHALALDCVLVTANEREFRRVPGLAVENWLA